VGEIFFWYRPTRVVPDQRPLNGRCCCCCCQSSAANMSVMGRYAHQIDALNLLHPAVNVKHQFGVCLFVSCGIYPNVLTTWQHHMASISLGFFAQWPLPGTPLKFHQGLGITLDSAEISHTGNTATCSYCCGTESRRLHPSLLQPPEYG